MCEQSGVVCNGCWGNWEFTLIFFKAIWGPCFLLTSMCCLCGWHFLLCSLSHDFTWQVCVGRTAERQPWQIHMLLLHFHHSMDSALVCGGDPSHSIFSWCVLKIPVLWMDVSRETHFLKVAPREGLSLLPSVLLLSPLFCSFFFSGEPRAYIYIYILWGA